MDRERQPSSPSSRWAQKVGLGPPEGGMKELCVQRSFLGKHLLDEGLRAIVGPQLACFGS